MADGRKEKPIAGEGRTEREMSRCGKKEGKASELGPERERTEGTKRETGGSERASAGGRGERER